MNDHLDDGTLQALLDDEIGGEAARAAREHLRTCRSCEASYDRVSRAAAGFSAAIRLLDDVEAIPLSRPATPPAPVQRFPGRFALPALSRAAVLLLTVTAAAAALPGSPLREWIDDRLSSVAPEPVASVETTASTAEPTERGASVQPVDGRLRIVVRGAPAGLRVRAVLTESGRGGAFAVGDADNTTFRAEAGLVAVSDPGGDELRVEIPTVATSASVEIDGRTYVVKDGDRLRLILGREDTLAEELVFTPLP